MKTEFSKIQIILGIIITSFLLIYTGVEIFPLVFYEEYHPVPNRRLITPILILFMIALVYLLIRQIMLLVGYKDQKSMD